MNKPVISKGQLLALSFLLLAMFLGAGNMIFAPTLGQEAGTNVWLAMFGFLVTGVGLVFLAIIALALSGGTVDKLSSRVHPTFAKVFSIVLFLTLAPIYVIPRATTIAFEISVLPYLPENTPYTWVYLLIFSFIFIAVTIFISLTPGKFVDRIGKMLTPVLLILLIVIVVKSILNPIGPLDNPQGEYIKQAFGSGFKQGYFTMDILAAFVFGGVFINAVRNLGVRNEKEVSLIFIKTGITAMAGLSVIYLSLAWMGASSVSVIGVSQHGAEALTAITNMLLGITGVAIFGIVVLLAGLTSNVALLAAASDYFGKSFSKFSYKSWVYIFGGVSFIISNFGLSTILELATPVLFFIYPIAIALVGLVLLNSLFKGYQAVYVGGIVGAAIMGLMDALKELNLLPNSILKILSYFPFYSTGMGWIVIAILGGIIGFIVVKLTGNNSKKYVNEKMIS